MPNIDERLSDTETKWSPPEGFFTKSAAAIASGLKSASKDHKQASARLNFYINRAGKNLSASEKEKLDAAKTKLASLYEGPQMQLTKLQALAEAAEPAAKKEMTPEQEEKIVKGVLRDAEDHLPHECRYKSYDVSKSDKTVDWVTQESSDSDGNSAAKAIAKMIKKAGVRGWTVRVTIRDNYRGTNTKWQGKAKS